MRVLLIHDQDRLSGLLSVLRLSDWRRLIPSEGYILFKGNCNTAAPYPTSTDAYTLRTICELFSSEAGRDRMVIGDGSSMFDKNRDNWTHSNMERLGWLKIPIRHAFFEEESEVPRLVEGQTIYLPETVAGASSIIYLPTLKVHGLPVPFSIALKATVGALCYRTREWMHEMRFDESIGFWVPTAEKPNTHIYERLILANKAIDVDLVIVDAHQIQVSGGPSSGDSVQADLYLASESRLGITAVGATIMKHYGTSFKWPTQRVPEIEPIPTAEAMGLGKLRDIRLETNLPLDCSLIRSIKEELQIEVSGIN